MRTFNFKKIGCMVIVIIVVILAAVGYINNIKNKQSAPPDTAYMVTTASRIYYTDEVTQQDGVYTIHNFYEKSGSKWVLRKKDLTLYPNIFGKVSIKGK